VGTPGLGYYHYSGSTKTLTNLPTTSWTKLYHDDTYTPSDYYLAIGDSVWTSSDLTNWTETPLGRTVVSLWYDGDMYASTSDGITHDLMTGDTRKISSSMV
jgi:hypothetical protein